MQPQADKFISWLPEKLMVQSIQQAMIADKYIGGLIGKLNIYAYHRDDLPSFALSNPIAAIIDSGVIKNDDAYNNIIGDIIITLYFGAQLIRNETTVVVSNTLATIRQRIQTPTFYGLVADGLFQYCKSLSYMRDEFDKQTFIAAYQQYQPLRRFGINCTYTPVNSSYLNGKDCYKATLSFQYWIMQQAYYNMLEAIGINAWDDPNKIVYPLWESIDINIEEI